MIGLVSIRLFLYELFYLGLFRPSSFHSTHASSNMTTLSTSSYWQATTQTQPGRFTIAVFAIGVSICYLLLHEVFTPVRRHFFPIRGNKWRLPPGPTGLPLIGSLYEWLSARRSPETLQDYLTSLARFGEMTTLDLGSKTWVLLNSPRVVKEIIAKNAAVTHE